LIENREKLFSPLNPNSIKKKEKEKEKEKEKKGSFPNRDD
jgi:hypothetical protein